MMNQGSKSKTSYSFCFGRRVNAGWHMKRKQISLAKQQQQLQTLSFSYFNPFNLRLESVFSHSAAKGSGGVPPIYITVFFVFPIVLHSSIKNNPADMAQMKDKTWETVRFPFHMPSKDSHNAPWDFWLDKQRHPRHKQQEISKSVPSISCLWILDWG